MALVLVLVPMDMTKATIRDTIRDTTKDTIKECPAAKAFRWALRLSDTAVAHRHSLLPFLVKIQTHFPLTRLLSDLD